MHNTVDLCLVNYIKYSMGDYKLADEILIHVHASLLKQAGRMSQEINITYTYLSG